LHKLVMSERPIRDVFRSFSIFLGHNVQKF